MKYILLLFKTLSAIITGVFMSLIGQAIINYSYFSFMFVFLTAFFAFFTLVKRMGFLSVLLIDLSFILITMLLKVYILMANK